MLDLPATMQPAIALLIVAGMLITFVSEKYPVEVVALSGAALMLFLGIVPEGQALAVFANPAPWTIAAMFLIVGALVRTGGLDFLSQLAVSQASQRPLATLITLTLTVLFLSAFVNNTPIVVVMIPIFMQLAKSMKVSPSKLLIPLSYFSLAARSRWWARRPTCWWTGSRRPPGFAPSTSSRSRWSGCRFRSSGSFIWP